MTERKQRVLGVQRSAAEVVASTADENTKYQVGDDIQVLLDEVLNNRTRAIFVFDDFSGRFTDFEMYQLSVVIKYNTSLSAITISGVDIGDESVAMLCQALIPSNVQYIDFTNTPLDEEAGSSLAALARCNTNLRTVIVTDTLINEDLMDEIDVACMDNEIVHDAPRVAPVRSPDAPVYCAAHLLKACPNGDYCLFSHAPPGCAAEAKGLLDWDKALPPPPKPGASWKAEEGEGGDQEGSPKGLTINMRLAKRRDVRRAAQSQNTAAASSSEVQSEKRSEKEALPAARRWWRSYRIWTAVAASLLCVGAVATTLFYAERPASTRRQRKT